MNSDAYAIYEKVTTFSARISYAEGIYGSGIGASMGRDVVDNIALGFGCFFIEGFTPHRKTGYDIVKLYRKELRDSGFPRKAVNFHLEAVQKGYSVARDTAIQQQDEGKSAEEVLQILAGTFLQFIECPVTEENFATVGAEINELLFR
jgi:hypothetical protein